MSSAFVTEQQVGRDLWKRARDKRRRNARFQIRQRVATTTTTTVASSVLIHRREETGAVGPAEARPQVGLSIKDEQEQVLVGLLRQLEAGRKSSFSSWTLAKHHDLLSTLIPTSLLSKFKIGTRGRSRFGPEHTEHVLDYIESISSCSIFEYAVWLGEYPTLTNLMSGGLDPTLRGKLHMETSHTDTLQEEVSNKRRQSISAKLLKRFFDRFPTSLSGYMVKRVVEMRMHYWRQRRQMQDHEPTLSPASCCVLCNVENPNVSFGSCCQHATCENCLWESLLKNIDKRDEGDVVRCPVCDAASPLSLYNSDNETVASENLSIIGDTPDERRLVSLQKFQQLPANVLELKKSSNKKRGIPKRQLLCLSWPHAVSRSTGSSQDVRQDKFFVSVEQNTYHYVKGCLVAGVDMNATNEYGQTALYVASWHGHAGLVQILLDFGADPSIAAHGGSTALRVSQRNGHDDVVAVLMESLAGHDHDSSRGLALADVRCSHASDLVTLIDPRADHPGAGALFVDNAISPASVDVLLALWKRLPIDSSEPRKKTGLCATRSYFCDAEGDLRRALTSAIRQGFADVTDDTFIYAHMRYLQYSQAGAVLAPHVDLNRTDLVSGKRSTHTFILYLHDCNEGGATLLLGGLSGEDRNKVLASVSPRRARLLLFPHMCPHSGSVVVDVPKLLLRGEVYLPA